MLKSVCLIFTFCAVAIIADDNNRQWKTVFQDDFQREKLGDAWKAVNGDWRISDGKLTCPSGGFIVINQDVDGFQRLEFTASSEKPGDLSPVIHCDGEDVDSGYLLQFGGMNNSFNQAKKMGENVAVDVEHLIEKGKPHRVIAEFNGERAKLTVNGEIVYDFAETGDAPLGKGHDRAGIYIYTQGTIDDVKLSVKPFMSREEFEKTLKTSRLAAKQAGLSEKRLNEIEAETIRRFDAGDIRRPLEVRHAFSFPVRLMDAEKKLTDAGIGEKHRNTYRSRAVKTFNAEGRLITDDVEVILTIAGEAETFKKELAKLADAKENAERLTADFVERGLTALPGANLLQCGDGENPALIAKWGGPVTRLTTDAHSGDACLRIGHISSATVPALVEIDRSKTYELSGFFKSADPDQPSRTLYDIRFYTADMRPIDPRMVQPISSVSELTEAAAKGDTVIKVAKKDWPLEGRLHAVAFNAKDNLSDLPNFDIAKFAGIKETDDGYEVKIRKPLTKSYPAGTGVRLHKYIDFPRIAINPIPVEWTRYAFKIAEKPVPGGRSQDFFWPGAKYMEVKILNQYRHRPKPLPKGENPPTLLFDDLTLKEVEPVQSATEK